MAGIAAVGFYVPRYSITAEEYAKALGTFAAPGIREKAVPGFDEDEASMAVEAAQRALAAGTGAVGFVALASSAKAGTTRTIADALGLGDVPVHETLGTRDAGEALRETLRHAAKNREPALFLASDAPRADPATPAEHPFAAGAIALFVTRNGGAAPVRHTPAAGPPSDVLTRIGDAGTATPFFPFLDALRTAKKGEVVRLATKDPIAFQLTAKPKGDLDVAAALKDRTYVTHEQYLGLRRHRPTPPGTEYSQGAYVSLPAYLGEAKARYRLVGEKCTECGRLRFPPRESCLACGARSWKDVPLKRTGAVHAYTIIGKGAAPSEFLEQQQAVGPYATAVVELDDGPRVTAMLTDMEPAAAKIGMRVRMVFRRIYTQEGVTRYGFKFAPA